MAINLEIYSKWAEKGKICIKWWYDKTDNECVRNKEKKLNLGE